MMRINKNYLPADPIDFGSIKNVVIYQQKNLGDALLITPVIKVLQRLSPSIKIVLITSKGGRSIFGNFHCVEKVLEEGKLGVTGFLKIKRDLRAVDLFLDFHVSSRSQFLGLLLRSKVSCGLASIRYKWWSKYTHHVPFKNDLIRHQAEKNLDVLRRLGALIEREDKKIRLDSLIEVGLDESIRRRLPEKFIHLHPGTRWLFKTLPPSTWNKVISYLKEKTQLPVVLTGGDQGIEGEFCSEISDTSDVISLVGCTSLNDLSLISTMASFYVGIDTFTSHIASASGVPGIVFFGPSDHRIWGPWGDDVATDVVRDGRACSPCNTDGCGGGQHSDSLSDLSFNFITQRIDHLLKKVRL